MGIIDNLTKNPSFLLLAGVGVALFVFRDKISDFFSTITGGIEAATTAGEISQGLLENLQGNLTGTTNALNQLTTDFGQFQTDVGTNFGLIGDQFAQIPDFFSNLFNQQQDDTPPQLDLSDPERAAALAALEAGRERARQENELDRIAASGEDISGAELNAARNDAEFRRRQQAALDAALRTSSSVQTDVEGNVFGSGGPSFVGGSVSEIPVSRLSLGAIIDRFNVTASQAADIRARAQDDFGGFDFGTNTGSGIGSVFPTQLNTGNVSNQSFAGLTATQIAQRLTGGLISNF